MRIQHNIMAMNSYRNYTNNTSALSKNLEKLSSGYRINRAGDDAAGLAISEKMRAQISGLKQAQSNAKSGINLVQTAEGALTEVHDMLNRMVTLADQSANGTYDNEVDRNNLQKEVSALQAEIDRIADASNFNGINLLDGSMGGPKVEATNGSAGSAAVKAQFTLTLNTGSISVADSKSLAIGDWTYDNSTGNAVTGDALATEIQAIDGQDVAIDGVTYTAKTTDGKTITFTEKANPTADGKAEAALTTAVGNAVTNGGTAVGGDAAVSAVTQGKAAVPVAAKTEIDFTDKTGADLIGGKMEIGTQKYQFVEDAADVATGYTAIVVGADDNAAAIATKVQAGITAPSGFTAGNSGNKFTLTETADPASGTEKAPAVKFSGMGMTLQIGDTSDEYNKISVSVQDMHCAALGIDLSKVDISTQLGASKAVDAIKNAINTVSSVRGDLGATQNRLEHTINNLSVMTENIQDAESTIRDVDVADEMMAYTKNNILVQSAQAMLAQANQVPQGVLQLLQ